MHTPSDKSQQPQSQAIANELSEKKGTGEAIKQFVDNRPEAIAQRKLQEMANNSEQVKQLKAVQRMIDHSQKGKKVIVREAATNNLSPRGCKINCVKG